METKMLEIRDRATCIPVMATLMRSDNKHEHYLLRRAGFSDNTDLIGFTYLTSEKWEWDPYNWSNSRTLHVAHKFVQEHWAELKSGDVVDVEFVLGETSKPKQSEVNPPWRDVVI